MSVFRVHSVEARGHETAFGNIGIVDRYVVSATGGRFTIWVSRHTSDIAATVYYRRYTKSGHTLTRNARLERVAIAHAVQTLRGDSREMNFVGL